MDDFDFDFGDFLGDISSGLDLSGGDTSWLDNFDWSGALENLDFSGLDLSNVYGDVGAGGLDSLINDLSGFDLETADQVYAGSDLGTGLSYYPGEGYGTGEAGGMGGAEGLIGDTDDFFGMGDGAGTIVITGKKENEPSILTDEEHVRTDVDTDKCPPGSEQVFKYRDGSTMTLDCKGRVIGSTPATINPDDPDSCPPGSETIETLADGTKVLKDCKGNIITTIKPTVDPSTPKPPTTPTNDTLAKILALLGGLAALSSRGGTSQPQGYQGGIPKYTAVRGPARSPTEGGRRPGGAGIGSLTGGVTYTPTGQMLSIPGAAQGGLMGLAEGGKARPARYLAGGTDGMADKIQTDIDGKQPARLSHGEFVIPADVVSHLGNGNSDAGANVLYDMMAKVRKARTGNPKQGKQINPRKYIPGGGQ